MISFSQRDIFLVLNTTAPSPPQICVLSYNPGSIKHLDSCSLVPRCPKFSCGGLSSLLLFLSSSSSFSSSSPFFSSFFSFSSSFSSSSFSSSSFSSSSSPFSSFPSLPHFSFLPPSFSSSSFSSSPFLLPPPLPLPLPPLPPLPPPTPDPLSLPPFQSFFYDHILTTTCTYIPRPPHGPHFP